VTTREIERQLRRQDRAIRTLAWWLVQAQSGLGQQDARGIEDILNGERDEALPDRDAGVSE
jgi:hypothetical protein